jgi:pectinesterase inhibitor-like protein
MAPSTSSTSEMSVVAVLLLFFPVAPALSPSAQIILAACKTVGGGSTYFDVQFCEEALGSVAGSVHSLNYQDLGGLAVGLLANNATSTRDKISRLLRGGGGGGDVKLKPENDAAVGWCLQSCWSLYGGIVEDGSASSSAIKAGKLDAASAILEKAADAAMKCEDGFGKGSVTSPLTREDDDAYKLAKLGVALLRFASEAGNNH